MINLLGYNRKDLEEFFTSLGEKSFRGAQVLKWIHQIGVADYALMTNLSVKLRQYLTENTVIQPPLIKASQLSQDGTRKWLLQLEDQKLVETVFIPEANRGTLCVSTQVGCPLGCAFCATGAQGYLRNLTSAEIIGQLWLAVREISADKTSRTRAITNVVFMGMGEPLLNFDNLIKAIDIMLDDCAYGLSKYRVTVSTCGIVHEIERLRKVSEVALAISLHAPNDELRDQLMPINKKYPLQELMAVCKHYYQDPRRKITIEYIMLDGVNDNVACAKQLVRLLEGVRCKVNLIPGNVVSSGKYRASQPMAIENFRNVLLAAGINTITRKSRGTDIAAACGQLAGEQQRILKKTET